ncbi:hypothetical protein [Microbacterium terregens]|uniref:DUF998 domain-containing protein n=1 Tax=Microbacterium terregens TaxID=69363 RepID=A0ABV5T204_9MICO
MSETGPYAAHARPVESTSAQRTHRYLRLGIGGTLVVILVAILLTVPTVGWLPSLSDYFYTPARNVFVGALVAASLALLALSGRDPERAVLDAAALFAPLIAVVPSVIRPGTVPGVEVECAQCVPAGFESDVVNGVATYLIVLAGVLLLGIVLSIRGAVRGAQLSLLLGGVVFAVVMIVGLTLPEVLLGWAHFVATVLFLGSIAADAVINAFWRTTSATPPRWLRIVYVAIAGVMIVDLLALVVITISTRDAVDAVFPWILIGEIVALGAFVAFWWLQTWQRWDETDPASLIAVSPRLPPL